MENGLTENNARIATGDYFDCPNTCKSRTVNWIKGDAYCPECGECGVVYPASVMKRSRERNKMFDDMPGKPVFLGGRQHDA